MDNAAKKLKKIIENDGWVLIKGSKTGGHFQFVHPTKEGRVTIPHRNIKNNIIKSVLKQAGLSGSVYDFRHHKIK